MSAPENYQVMSPTPGGRLSDYLSSITKLNSAADFVEWKFGVTRVARSFGLASHLNDEPPKYPSTQWQADDDKFVVALSATVSQDYRGYVIHAANTYEAYKNLIDSFELRRSAGIVTVLKQLINSKIQPGDDVQSFLVKVKNCFRELEAHDQVLTEKLQVGLVAANLPESYASVADKLTDKDNMTWSRLSEFMYGREIILKEKREEHDSALLANGAGKSWNPKLKFPCNYCKRLGHWKAECPKRKMDDSESASYANVLFVEVCEDGQQEIESREALPVPVNEEANLSENSEWIVDSGATSHLTSQKFFLNDYEKAPAPMTIGLLGKSTTQAIGRGNVNLDFATLKNVLFIPESRRSLMSISKIQDEGMSVEFPAQSKDCHIKRNGKVIATAYRKNGLYALNNGILEEFNVAVSGERCHRRFGHLGYSTLKEMKAQGAVEDLEFESPENGVCDACEKGKHKRPPFALGGSHISTSPLEIIHSDVCGPMSVDSASGKRYFLTFIDDYSNHLSVFFLRQKSEVYEKFKQYVATTERSTGKKVKLLITDRGGEYMNIQMKEYCESSGISQRCTAGYSPQQNGKAERMNLTIVDLARTMLIDSGMPRKFWAEAVQVAVYIRNRCISSSLPKAKTPIEMFTGQKPSVKHLRPFGCYAYFHKHTDRRKLDAKAKLGILLGYGITEMGYRIFDFDTKKVIISRDVTFDESKMYKDLTAAGDVSSKRVVVGSLLPISTPESRETSEDTRMLSSPVPSQRESSESSEEMIGQSSNSVLGRLNATERLCDANTESREQLIRRLEARLGEDTVEHSTDHSSNSDDEDLTSVEPRRSTRQRRRPSWWDSTYEAAGFSELVFAAEVEPKSYKDVIGRDDEDKWRQACHEEYDALIDNQTWELETLPAGKNLISSKWVFKIKTDEKGNPSRYKARLVARGFSQKLGEDYFETFAPVIRFESIRSIIAVSTLMNLVMHQLDIKTAFLNGELQEEIYMEQPEGFFQKGKEHLVCKLKKSLYGLKQAPRCWNLKLVKYLSQNGFRQCMADTSIFVRNNQDGIVIAGVYVDDILLAATSETLATYGRRIFESGFKTNYLGKVKYFLGHLINQNIKEGWTSISQKRYVQEMLIRFGMQDCKPAFTPQASGASLSKEMCPATKAEIESMQGVPYRNAVGALMYLMVGTRPDIAIAVTEVSRFLENPGMEHWIAVKRIFRYLKRTHDYELRYSSNGGNNLVGFSDASWAADVDDRRSTSGYVFTLAGAVISWKSKKQATVAQSSTEAEYIALSLASNECIWLRELLADLQLKMKNPTILYEDNQAAIKLAHNPVYHSRTKHIDLRYHVIRERIEKGLIGIAYLETENMPADMLTKAIGKIKFDSLRKKLGLFETTH